MANAPGLISNKLNVSAYVNSHSASLVEMNSYFPEGYSLYLLLNSLQLLEYDRERAAFQDIITEEEILFPPRWLTSFREILKNVRQECCVYIVCTLYTYLNVVVALYFRSYPYSEDYTKPTQYMNTRCPAWCDRILMSHSARDIIYRVSATLTLMFIGRSFKEHISLLLPGHMTF